MYSITFQVENNTCLFVPVINHCCWLLIRICTRCIRRYNSISVEKTEWFYNDRLLLADMILLVQASGPSYNLPEKNSSCSSEAASSTILVNNISQYSSTQQNNQNTSLNSHSSHLVIKNSSAHTTYQNWLIVSMKYMFNYISCTFSIATY